jgi:hypothetical protein
MREGISIVRVSENTGSWSCFVVEYRAVLAGCQVTTMLSRLHQGDRKVHALVTGIQFVNGGYMIVGGSSQSKNPKQRWRGLQKKAAKCSSSVVAKEVKGEVNCSYSSTVGKRGGSLFESSEALFPQPAASSPSPRSPVVRVRLALTGCDLQGIP